MPTKHRDDFSKVTKETMAKRVTYCCSNPECRKPTSGPHSNKNKSINIGVAAHIKAAAPGGPRYDKDMTAEERSDISNGIWLCQSCSKLIDTNPDKYTVDILNNWKQMAEDISSKAIESDGTFKDDVFSIAFESRLNNELEINNDIESTVLTQKMKKGEFDNISIINAKEAKIHAIKIINILKSTEVGRKTLNKIYSEVKTSVITNIYMKKQTGDLIREDMSLIKIEMERILNLYSDKECIDLQFLMGLLYIATSNCAMLWKYGSETDETSN